MTGKTIVITSGKGGVGKTTTTANLGTGLAMRGHKVLIIDTDIGLRNLDVVMGLENRIVYDLVDVIEERCEPSKAMIRDKHKLDLFLIPAPQTRDKDCITSEQLADLCRTLEEEFEYIIIDCPAGIETGFKNAISAAQEAIIVTTPEVSAVRDADRVIGLLDSAGIKNPGLIINRIHPDLVAKGDMLDKDDIVDILAVDILGLVPIDDKVITSTNQGIPVVHSKNTASGAAFYRIAGRIAGEDIPLQEPQSPSFMKKIKALVGLKGGEYTHA
jgi:septum site-determining protein MinD